jgi:N-formylglutamate deformylase
VDAFRIHRPTAQEDEAACVLYDSPHSGRHYPSDFDTALERTELRRAEDAYVDELLAGTTRYGACVLEALFPRSYIDLNRAESDIDATLLSEPWPGAAPTEKSRRGLGLIRRYTTPGREINSRLLEIAEVRDRIDRVYRPYHAALDALASDMKNASGFLWHVNWHSMKSVGNEMTPDGAGAPRPDFVVSDRDGRSASPRLTEWIAGALRSFGYTVSLNDPYKGGTIVERLGSPIDGFHSLQIEINRGLYLDEVSVTRNERFAELARNIEAFTAGLVELARRGLSKDL